MTWHSLIGRVAWVVVMTLCVLGGLGGLVAFGVVAWRFIPNHAVALLAIVLIVPLFLWGLTQED